MGVDGLYKFINKNFPDIFNNVSITEISGKSCIIDGMQHIYGQLIYMRSRDKEVFTLDGKNISHIHGLINSLTYYLKNGIVPIFIFDGKTPDIKKNKIEERKKNLKENLSKLKELEDKKNNLNKFINNLTTEITEIIDLGNNINDLVYDNNDSKPNNLLNENILDDDENIIYGTPPTDTINLDEEIAKMNNIQEEYKRIYKKSIVMKDYFIKDWIEILELLGLPVIKASGEADPLCAYMLKNNPHIYGIISDDSDMLVFGAPILMRKSINQQFTIIELKKILDKMESLLFTTYDKHIKFDIENLIDYSILLGTDYGNFKLNEFCSDSSELLKYYVSNNKDYKKLISQNDYEKFDIIKKYYLEQNFNEEYNEYLGQPKWKKPKLMELKKRLLELQVDEDYIDKNNEYLDFCYNRIKKGKYIFKNYNDYYSFNNSNNKNYKLRSNSFDSKKSYYNNKSNYFDKDLNFKRITKNPTFYSEKIYSYDDKINFNQDINDSSSNSSGDNEKDNEKDNQRDSLSSIRGDEEIFFFET